MEQEFVQRVVAPRTRCAVKVTGIRVGGCLILPPPLVSQSRLEAVETGITRNACVTRALELREGGRVDVSQSPSIPEPGTLGLMAVGLAGLAGLSALRRRKKH